MGFPVFMFVVVHGIYQMYQFFVHTDLIPRLGPLEWVLATPRHHRVHHGRNPAYLDKNYGGFFIIWDRLFDTFAAETERPEIGTSKGLSSWSPLWANYGHFITLAQRSGAASGIRSKLRVWFGPPEDALGNDEPAIESIVPRYDAELSRPVATFVIIQMAGTAALTLYLLVAHDGLSTNVTASIAALIISSLTMISAILDVRSAAPSARADERPAHGSGGSHCRRARAAPSVHAVSAS
jgi:alkylglycerol monooxygenase